jgi:hypothetical protein
MEKLNRILIIAHDPGGANAVGSLALELDKNDYFCTEVWALGYAKVFYEKLGVANIKEIDIDEFDDDLILEAIRSYNPDLIITGTSANSYFEKNVWRISKKNGLYCICILDQWMNYGIRFSQHNLRQWNKSEEADDFTYSPNEIWVMDEVAQSELEKLQPNLKIIVTGQPYFDFVRGFKEDDTKKNKKQKKRILFISEPLIETHFDKYQLKLLKGYNEFEVLEALLSCIDQIKDEFLDEVEVVIRLHPKDTINKYNDMIMVYKSRGVAIKYDQMVHNLESISKSDAVIGMSSMMLLEAAIMEKDILSIQLNMIGKNPFILSQLNIVETITNSDDLRVNILALINHSEKKIKWIPIRNVYERILSRIKELL